MSREGGLRAKARGVAVDSAALALNPFGFKKVGDRFLRRQGQVTQVIEVQWSHWSDAQAVSFTFNGGLYVPRVTSVLRNRPDPKSPKLTDCCLSARIGMLTESSLDLWWSVAEGDSAEAFEQSLRGIQLALENAMVPFLERFKEPQAIARFLEQPTGVGADQIDPRAQGLRLAYAAALWSGLGDAARCHACFELAVQSSKATPLEEVLNVFKERLRC